MRLLKTAESMLKIGPPWVAGVETAVEQGLDHGGERQPSMTPDVAPEVLLSR
jgi:hypothetical protein